MLLYLIRHGETDHNVQGKMQGWTDVPLNENGLRQAQLLAQRFKGKPLDAVYASDLVRAAATAQAVADVCSKSVQLDSRLREYNMGDWSGKTVEEVAHDTKGLPRNSAGEYAIPNGDSADEMHARMRAFLDDVLERHAPTREQVVAVSHGGTLGMLVATMLHLPVLRRQPFSFGNTAICKAQYEHGKWRLHTLNDQCHLRAASADAVDG